MPQLNILLLEDSPIDAELVCHRLESAGIGCSVRHVTNGKDFRAALRDCVHYDLVLSDYDLPDIDGMTALRETLAHCPETPFIFVSGKLGEEAAVQSLQQGATDYVVKLRLDRLLPAVRRAVHEATERRKRRAAEAALRDAQSRLRASLEASEIATWVWNVQTDHVDGDRNLGRLFWLDGDPTTITLERLIERLHPDDRDRVRACLRATLDGAEPRYNVDFRVQRPDGSLRWVVARGYAERDSAGRPLRVPGVILDITERKQLEIAREQALQTEQRLRREAEHVSRMKDEFLATLSHELRTPLSAVLGWSQILRRRMNADREIAAGLEVIERNARSQARLVEDLLDMSRIISGTLRLKTERVDLRDVVRAAIDVTLPAAEARRIHLESRLGDEPALVIGDPARLQQVVWNLLTNAVKFTPPDGLVFVSLEPTDDGHIAISVADTGSGISREFLPHVFDRFRQADASTTRSFGGLGLGLSIVKSLVEVHGGTATAASDGEGRGSRFIVKLPIDRESKTTPPQLDHVDGDGNRPRTAEADGVSPAGGNGHALPLVQSRLAGLNVLVVDDESDARNMLRQLLIDRGATVRTAASAADARGAIAEAIPDVLISDIGMPGEDGYQLIRSLDGRAPLSIALTAFARPSDRDAALAAGFDAHFSKPLETDELLAFVAHRIEEGQIAKQAEDPGRMHGSARSVRPCC